MQSNYLKGLLFFTLLTFGANHLFAQDTTQGFKLFFEKVYLHTDRNFYNPGDKLWFKAYLVNGQNNQPFSTSNNLYVELIDPVNTIVSRRVIRIDSGVGRGNFEIEDSAMGGAYRLRAYTNWMRNFGDNFIFEKPVEVNHIAGISKSNTALINKTLAANKNNAGVNGYKIQFMPESGIMVEGVPTVVAFKAEDANGQSLQATGAIVSAKGDTVARFKTIHNGMGSFAFKPEAGMQYTAWVHYSEYDVVKATFPQALPNGFVMNVTDEDTGKVTLTINSNEATRALHPTGVITIAGRHAGKSYYKQTITLKDGKATVTMPKKDFPQGIANITLYDESMHPHCERLVCIENNHPLNITVFADKQAYSSKEKVRIDITVTDAQQRAVKAALSLSATDVSTDKVAVSNISTYLLLQSELKGNIENASAYFDKNNPQRLQQLDLLLRTQGWRSFLWRRLADTSVRISYLPEPGITISGIVTKVDSKVPLANYNVTLFAPGAKGDKVFLTKTNDKGRYYLDGLALYGNQTITLNAANPFSRIHASIKMDTLFNNILPVSFKPYRPFDTSDNIVKLAQEAARRRAMFSNLDSVHRLADVTVRSGRSKLFRLGDGVYNSFGYPEYDFTITPQDYSYKSLEWFLQQKVPGARSTADAEGVTFFAAGKEIRPRFIIDRTEDVFDRVDYYRLSMEQIESVSVRHVIGNPTNQYNSDSASLEVTRGINDVFLIYLKLKPGAYNQQFSKIKANINGYYEAQTFYAPNYPVPNSTKTDVRNTIHWEPLINTDNNGKATLSFFNADPKTTIRIDLQGLTANGIPITGGTTYVVK